MQGAGRKLARIGILLLAGDALAGTSLAAKPIESAHRAGPNGLEGWTVSDQSADGQHIPTNLVIAQLGHVLRRIRGDPFVSRWMFWANGKQVAYVTGSLHFNASCTLVDIAPGRQLAALDCFRELDEDASRGEKYLRNDK